MLKIQLFAVALGFRWDTYVPVAQPALHSRFDTQTQRNAVYFTYDARGRQTPELRFATHCTAVRHTGPCSLRWGGGINAPLSSQRSRDPGGWGSKHQVCYDRCNNYIKAGGKRHYEREVKFQSFRKNITFQNFAYGNSIFLTRGSGSDRVNCCWSRQHSQSWFRVLLESMTIFLFFPRLLHLEMDPLLRRVEWSEYHWSLPHYWGVNPLKPCVTTTALINS
jgi:hypothetical protein